MKKSYLILLLCSFLNYSQNKISFIDNNHKETTPNLSKSFSHYKIVTVQDHIDKLANGQKIVIDLGQNLEFVLKENRLLANNYVLSLKGENKIERKNIYETNFDGKYFYNDDISINKQCVLSTFENTYSIYIKNEETEFYIEPLKNYVKNANTNDYVFYYAKDAVNENLECALKNNSTKVDSKQEKQTLTGGCKTVELAMSVDYNVYNTYGSVNATINRTMELLNLTQANYTIANGLSDDVQFKITEHYIVTCDSNCNYWLPTLEIYDNYNNFGAFASRMFVNPYDIKVHWQNQGGTGSVIGLGSYVMCGTSGIAVVKNYSGNTNQTRCIFSHELGHNFDCVHNTDIMAAIISLSNSWSAASITTINTSLNTLSCITNCNATLCDNKNVKDAVVTVDAPQNKINVSWLAETGIDFKVRLYNYNTSSWSPYTTFAYPNNNTFYTYSQVRCNDNYRVEITPFCGAIPGVSEQIVVRTSGNVPAPVLTLSANVNQALCGANTSYFTATAIDGGTAPSYQWKINGVNVGTNSATFSSNTLVNNDVLSCTLTSNASCVASPFASASAVLNITTPTVLSVSIAASETTICAGTPVTLTATGVNITGTYPFYRWFLNGVAIPSGQPGGTGGTSGPVITVNPTSTGDVYTCNLSDGGATCHTGNGLDGSANSNSITITIQNPCTLGIDTFADAGLNVYPNPVIDVLNITSKIELNKVTIFNVLGQQVFYEEVNSSDIKMNLSNFPKATYFIKLTSGESSKTVKIIKE